MYKKLTAISASLFLFLFIALPTYAQTINPCPKNASQGFSNLCNWDKNTLAKMIQNGITILFIVAVIASLFFLVFGGIKWITSGGDKAKLEESRNWIVAAAVGLVITFLSYFILNLILGLFGLPTIGDIIIPSLVK